MRSKRDNPCEALTKMSAQAGCFFGRPSKGGREGPESHISESTSPSLSNVLLEGPSQSGIERPPPFWKVVHLLFSLHFG